MRSPTFANCAGISGCKAIPKDWAACFLARPASPGTVYAHVDRASESGLANARAIANGSEFISRDLDLWAYQRDVVRDFSRPGKPTDNAYIESFNGKFRAECLNQHWFLNL